MRVRLPTIGVLSPGPPATRCGTDSQSVTVCNFMDGLRAFGYIEGRNVTVEYRYADGNTGRLPELARELVALQPDVIFTHTGLSADAIASATSTIPIVVGPAGEMTLTRLAGNLARPTRNVTGTTLNTVGQDEKCLQLLKEIAPHVSRVAVLFNPDNFDFRDYPGVLAPAARQGQMTLIGVEVRNSNDLAKAFETIAASNANALLLTADNRLTASNDVRERVIEWASNRRLPLASPSYRVAAGGGLLSVSTDLQAPARRAAYYVHRILGGAKPADLPIELPTTFKLSINAKSAASLGVRIPQPILLRADELIQ